MKTKLEARKDAELRAQDLIRCNLPFAFKAFHEHGEARIAKPSLGGLLGNLALEVNRLIEFERENQTRGLEFGEV